MSTRTSRFRIGWFSVIFMILVAALLPLSNVFAQGEQTGNGLRISPVRFEVEAEPGQSDTFEINVTNISGGDISVANEINDFIPEGDNGSAKIVDVDDNNTEFAPYSISTFLEPVADFSLKPGEEKTVRYVVNVPEGASPGGYFGAVRFVAQSPEGQGSETTLNASLGGLVFVRVPGDYVELLEIADVYATQEGASGSIFETGPNGVAVSIKNNGNIFSQPFGRVVVKDWRDNVIHEYELNSTDTRRYVLPNSTRTFHDSLENVSGFGKYKIEVSVSYGEGGGNIITATSSFWVIPWKVILVLVAAIVAAVVIGKKGLKVYSQKVVEKSRGEKSKK